MAVSVLERPLGHIFDQSAELSVETITNSSGDALVTDTAHGLTDTDYVYIKSPIEAYCGFWYVDQQSSSTFKIKRSSGAAFQAYVKDATTTTKYYKVTSSHTWNCVHLPIIYKLSNTAWPVNSEDTARTMTAVTDSNGYCALALSGDIKTTGAAAKLEFVKITNSGQDGAFEDLDGIYQIIEYTNDTTFTINLPYSTGADFSLQAIGAASDALIQYYYNNYHIKVISFK